MSDPVKYWLIIAGIMLAMYGYSGRLTSPLIFGIAGIGAFAYWRITLRRKGGDNPGEDRRAAENKSTATPQVEPQADQPSRDARDV